MSRAFRVTSAAYAVLWLVIGLLLLIVPGRFLGMLGWPSEPIIARILGAALLALAWASFRGWNTRNREVLSVTMELGIIFSVLAAVGVLRHTLIANYPLVAWGTAGVFVIFAVLWILAMLRR